MAAATDNTPVASLESESDIQSIGNSETLAPRDLVDDDDVRRRLWRFGESISERMRENGFEASNTKISVRK